MQDEDAAAGRPVKPIGTVDCGPDLSKREALALAEGRRALGAEAVALQGQASLLVVVQFSAVVFGEEGILHRDEALELGKRTREPQVGIGLRQDRAMPR